MFRRQIGLHCALILSNKLECSFSLDAEAWHPATKLKHRVINHNHIFFIDIDNIAIDLLVQNNLRCKWLIASKKPIVMFIFGDSDYMISSSGIPVVVSSKIMEIPVILCRMVFSNYFQAFQSYFLRHLLGGLMSYWWKKNRKYVSVFVIWSQVYSTPTNKKDQTSKLMSYKHCFHNFFQLIFDSASRHFSFQIWWLSKHKKITISQDISICKYIFIV